MTSLEHVISEWIFIFVACNQFLGGVVGSTIVSQLQALTNYGVLYWHDHCGEFHMAPKTCQHTSAVPFSSLE